MSTVDDIAPSYLREERIDLTLAVGQPEPRAFFAILCDVGTLRTKPAGLVLPLILEVQGPSAASYERTEYHHAVPGQIVFVPREGGRHLVTLREAAHNRWFGSLRVDVAGELLEAPRAV